MNKKAKNIKRERFKNVAARRVQKVLDDLDSLSKCANKNNYEFEAEDVGKMIAAIEDKIRMLESSFNANTKSTKNTFQF
jgi:hypothetical protein